MIHENELAKDFFATLFNGNPARYGANAMKLDRMILQYHQDKASQLPELYRLARNGSEIKVLNNMARFREMVRLIGLRATQILFPDDSSDSDSD